MKKFLLFIIGLLCFLPMTVRAGEKVKVYVFEAGGCPYCEAQIEYLEGLDSYNQKFEIVQKELYVDHVDWAQGKDYELGVKVANEFYSKGFTDASYQGTPFVVISNLYAAAAYSQNLETVIDKAYEEGDKDVVSCIANNGENCLEGATNSGTATEEKKDNTETITIVILSVIVVGLIALIIITRKANKEEEMLDKAFSIEDDDEELKKAAAKKTKEETKVIETKVVEEVTKAANMPKAKAKVPAKKPASKKSAPKAEKKQTATKTAKKPATKKQATKPKAKKK